MRSWHAVKDLVIKPHVRARGPGNAGQNFPSPWSLEPAATAQEQGPRRCRHQVVPRAHRGGQGRICEEIRRSRPCWPSSIRWPRSQVSKDENDNAECTNAFLTLDEIAHQADLFCLTTDHLPKDENATKPRGGGAKYDAADSILRICVGDGEARTLHVDKVRGDEGGKEIPFRLIQGPRGVDSDGDPITAVRIAWSEEVQPARARGKRWAGPENLHHLRCCVPRRVACQPWQEDVAPIQDAHRVAFSPVPWRQDPSQNWTLVARRHVQDRPE